MNKTVNINLAGIFFHIDEDAYLKLQRYLEAIKRSFTDSQGRSEIIADIEARIAELFTERMQYDKQVIGNKEVDEVITIMGQPEDYLVDDEIFEDEPYHSYQKSTRNASKKLYRDKDNSYIAGVSSGLGHYLGIDAVWVRLLWLLLTIGSGGTFILIYILFWILVPEAITTSEKLTMKGEPVNISNIEKKIKDGFDQVSHTVSESVKNVDFESHGNKLRSSSKSFFDTIGDIIMFFLKVAAKIVGVILILFGALGLFALLISLVSLGSMSDLQPMEMDYFSAVNTVGLPIWLGGLILFTIFAIPLFFVLYLGLKILINNLKSIGRVAKFSLLGLWMVALFSMIYIGINQASYFTLENSVLEKDELPVVATDTLAIRMVYGDHNKSRRSPWHNNGFELSINEDNEKIIYSRDVDVYIRSTRDSVAFIEIEKEASGRDFVRAKQTAQKIIYNYEFKNGELLLNNFLETDFKNKFLDQNVKVYVYLPIGTTVELNENTSSFLRNNGRSSSITSYDDGGHSIKVLEDSSECLDCDEDEGYKINIDVNNEKSGLKINADGVEIKDDSLTIKIDSSGVEARGEGTRLKVNEDGMELVSDDN